MLRGAPHEAAAQSVFKALEFQAHCHLAGLHSVGHAGEAAQLGNGHKGFENVEVQWTLLLLSVLYHINHYYC